MYKRYYTTTFTLYSTTPDMPIMAIAWVVLLGAFFQQLTNTFGVFFDILLE